MTEYPAEIAAAAKPYGLDPDLLEALVIVESSGRADAFRYEPGYYARYLANNPAYEGKNPRRVASSYGLCQVMYPTALQYGFRRDAEPEMLFLPGVNLDLGARILSNLLARYGGNVESALQAYNGGPGNVGSAATVAYSRKVLGALKGIQG